MKKSLAQRAAPWIFGGLGLIAGGCARTFYIDESNKVTDYRNDLIHTKDLSEIRDSLFIIKYYANSDGDVYKTKIINLPSTISSLMDALDLPKKRKYDLKNMKNPMILNMADKRYKYLTHKIDSIKALGQ